jgi:hypothetical protein
MTIFAIPNGGARGKIEAAIMKGEGVLAGVADLFVMHPNEHGMHGLFIEMKSATGRLSPMQKEFQKQARAQGYSYGECRSLDEFMMCVDSYLNSKL